jgi:hypothetical protein
MSNIQGALTIVISIVILVFAILAIINGFQYKEYRLPIIGNLAVNLTDKFKDVQVKIKKVFNALCTLVLSEALKPRLLYFCLLMYISAFLFYRNKI